jgi:glycerol-3-phosphate dehydrogenase
MNRGVMMKRAEAHAEPWDIVVIGGGATGVGVAVDAATRGYDTLLLEQHDFGKGTSGRSTKLVHGGVRYLEQGNVGLVIEALRERGIMRQNAPHLVHELPFVVPSYSWWEGPFFGIGLKLYQILSGKYGFGPSEWLSKEETLRRLPNINPEGLKGGVIYYDGQFDDTRFLINLATTAAAQGATLLNYAEVTALSKDGEGIVNGVGWKDVESGATLRAGAKVVINAGGPFCDAVRHLADPGASGLISPSQGAHLVFDKSFLPGETAIMVPHTRDGRVLFAIPWHGHTLVGTTDVPVEVATLEPIPLEQEIEFILESAAHYLARKPARSDILSTFAGIRPLKRAGAGVSTAALSRDHSVHIDSNGLLSITGGKWTTYRNMAQEAVDQAAALGGLDDRDCVTKTLNLHGYHTHAAMFGALAVYGTDAASIEQLTAEDPALAVQLDLALPTIGAEIIWAAREEMARTVEDVLARRTRALLLDAKAAVRMAPAAAALLARELGRDEAWQSRQISAFTELARGYQVAS